MNKIIIANWKMNPSSKKEAEIMLKSLFVLLKNLKKVEVVICPPTPFLFIKEKLKIKNKKVKLGAQDIFYEKEGSYTGEISTSMAKSLNAEYVIIGHSERRVLGDNNQDVNRKILATLKSGMMPIFCVGEKDRDSNGFYLSFIKQQLEEGLENINKPQVKNIIIAYEPVWAIGGGATREATPAEFIETKIFIKKIISDLYDIKTANEVKIIYGGSVNTNNANSFIKEGDADGLLVGRESLVPKKFSEIVHIACM